MGNSFNQFKNKLSLAGLSIALATTMFSPLACADNAAQIVPNSSQKDTVKSDRQPPTEQTSSEHPYKDAAIKTAEKAKDLISEGASRARAGIHAATAPTSEINKQKNPDAEQEKKNDDQSSAADTVKDKAKDATEDAKKKGEEIKDKAGEAAEKGKDKIKDAAKATEEKGKEVKSKLEN